MADGLEELFGRAREAKLNKRFGEAQVALRDAAARLRSDPMDLRGVMALRELAETERKLGEREAAREHYEQAVQQLRLHSDALALAHTVRHLGDVHRELGRSDLAEPCYREALELYDAHTEASRLDVANALRSMAVLKEDTGAAAEAAALWKRARELYQATGIQAGVDESTRRLARLTS